MAKARKKKTSKRTSKRAKKTGKKRARKKVAKRVTLAASTLDKLISVGAGHHAQLVRLRKLAKPVKKARKRK